ncbi:peptide/nickel transport system substrate-binding protein [Amycolatopsis bartoniae]|uniref:Peptide ABC transporter permease n=1 Tax=Amycolatopsis bartoniae TaxID=941986 RepID=A0A8H9IR81_9PSEU|nr:ABC transporter substrate-binding protein [Amycolatopsis bartoniae]MBB2937695.1 peptide/nickel transport system substrate-binding protein [Amycolatopsis bartoniae]TVT08215.1 ABC transporter substrate-binding protein [Amycolatopsis bartoniae]GHF39992.1 peptide ABC transporter permease [Amycolatopsis bartoniae]
MFPRSRILPLAAASALLAAGCSAGTTAADAGPPRAGGTLTLAVGSNPDCLDPQQASTNASLNVGRQLVDSLTDQDPKTGEIKPWLADSWQVNADSTSFTFHLRPGATFSDGTPVDAAAVKTSFDGIKALGVKAALGSGYLAAYQGSTVVDPQTVRLDFAAPSAQFLQASSTMSLGVLAPAAYAKSADQRCQGDGLVGSGPFVFTSFKQNADIVLSKRKGYAWGSSLWQHQGEAYLDRIDYKVVPEPGVRTGSLLSGQLSATTEVQPVDEAQFQGNGFGEQTRPNPGIVFNLHANTTRGVLTDEVVRQAVSAGIDRQEVVDTVLSPNYKPATSILATTTPLYTDLSADLKFDPARAARLLDGDGWVPGPDGIRVKNGQRLSAAVVFAPVFNQNQSVLELVQQQLRKIGFDLRIEQHTTAESTQLQQAGNYDFLWYNVTRTDPDILRNTFSTKAGNRSKLPAGNPLDAQLDAQAASLDPAVRRPAAEQAQKLIVEHAYAIPVFELTQVVAFGQDTHAIGFEASSRLQLFDTWVSGS